MITLVTVNYQDPSHTLRLIDDLNAQTRNDFCLVVIDNNSDPKHREQLQQRATSQSFSLTIIWSATNRGFAGGTNQGLRWAQEHGASWMLIINNDTRVEPSFIEDLHSQLATQQAGIIGLPIVEHGRRIYSGTIKWLQTQLHHSEETPSEHSYIIGAGILLDATTLAQLGPLDERYFLYFEDTEYTLRARKQGIRVGCISHPIIIHTPSQSTSKLSRALLLRYHTRNALLLNQTHGPWWVRMLVPAWTTSILIRNIVKYLCMPSSRDYARAIIQGACDTILHRYGKIT